MLGENAIAVRTKAMKCLSEVVAVDPSILARVRKKERETISNHTFLLVLFMCIYILLVVYSWICNEVFMDG